jgi:predicted dehydrogenase
MGFFRKIKNVDLVPGSLESSLDGNSKAVFLDGDPALRATYAIMLLEQNRDLISSYPIATSLSEYSRIQEYLHRHNGILGLINPLRFYTSVYTLKRVIMKLRDPLTDILISSHPREIIPGCRVDGVAGTAQFLQRMVSYFSDRFPVALKASTNETGGLSQLWLDYSSFETRIIFDPMQVGWTMDVTGPDFRARSDSTGVLTVNDEPQPRVDASSLTWERAMIENLEDFTSAVRNRSEPVLSSLDGLASIILNNATEQSARSGLQVSL